MDIRKIKDKIIVDGYLGVYFKRNFRGTLSDNKQQLLFTDIGVSKLEFYEFFALEVFLLLRKFVQETNSMWGVNVKAIQIVLDYLENETWLRETTIDNQECLVELDTDREDCKEFLAAYNEEPITNLNLDNLKRDFKWSILPHQYSAFKHFNALKRINHLRGALLDAEPGTGKTAMSLMLASATDTDVVVVIAPLNTIDEVWHKALGTLPGQKHETYYKKPIKHVYGMKELNKGERVTDKYKFFLVHYQQLHSFKEALKKIDSDRITMIVDESHNFNTPDTSRVENLIEISEILKPINVILLSGTPIKAKPLEMVPMLRLLDPKFNKYVEARFRKFYKHPSGINSFLLNIRYGIYRDKILAKSLKLKTTEETILVDIPNATDFTLKKIGEDMIKYTKARVSYFNDNSRVYEEDYERLLDKAIGTGTEHELSKTDVRNYKSNVETIIKFYKKNRLMEINETMKSASAFEKKVLEPRLLGEDKKRFRECKSVVKYVKLKIQGEVLGRVVMAARIDCHNQIAKYIDYDALINSTDKKVVIFTNYTSIAETAVAKCKDLGYRPLTVFGTKKELVTDTIYKFGTDPLANPLVATVASLSEGVPVTMANTVLFIDIPFRVHTLQQAIKRLSRLGQTDTVSIYYTKIDTGELPNINSRGVDIVNWSKEQIKLITGNEFDIDLSGEELTDGGISFRVGSLDIDEI